MNLIKIDDYIEMHEFWDSIFDVAKIIRYCLEHDFNFYVVMNGKLYENEQIKNVITELFETDMLDEWQENLIHAAVMSLSEKESGKKYILNLDDYSVTAI